MSAKSEENIFEKIFERISFPIDLITEKYQITDLVSISYLVELIKTTENDQL